MYTPPKERSATLDGRETTAEAIATYLSMDELGVIGPQGTVSYTNIQCINSTLTAIILSLEPHPSKTNLKQNKQ